MRIVALFVMPLAFTIYLHIPKKEGGLTLQGFKQSSIVGVVSGIALGCLFILPDLGVLPPVESTYEAVRQHSLYELFVLLVVLSAPGEELLFRGLFQTRLEKKIKRVYAILLVSLVFGALHFTYGAWVGVILGFIGGLVYGSIFEYKKSLVAPILGHSIANSISLLSSWMVVQYGIF
jgi:hypothetical protein